MLICELSFLQFTIWKLLGRGKKKKRGKERGGQRCKWIYSSNHRHREHKQFQLKHFLLRWEAEGWRLQRGQTLWTSAWLLCFAVWDTASAATDKLSRFLQALQTDLLTSIKSTVMHFISLSLCPSTETCLFLSYLTRSSVRKSLMEEAQRKRKKKREVLLYFIIENLTRRSLASRKQTPQWTLGNMCVSMLNGESLSDGNFHADRMGLIKHTIPQL